MSDGPTPADPGPAPPAPPARPPRATLKPVGRLALGWFWVLPGTVLLFVVLVVCLSLSERGPRILVQFKEGHGLKAGDAVRHRGITVGEVYRVKLTPDLKGVDVELDLQPMAAGIAVEDSRFWIVRPQADLTGVSGLDTVVGAKYVAVRPGSGAGRRQFVGSEEPVADEQPGGLRIVVQDRRTGGLRPGAPLTYRGVRIGSVVSSGLAGDASAVDIQVHVLPAYKDLVREKSRFWNVSGFKVQVGWGLTLNAESVQTVLAGGMAMATPAPPGKAVSDGFRFPLAEPSDKELAEWQAWNPSIPLVNPNLPKGMTVPRLVRATLKYNRPGRVYGTIPAEHRGLLLPVDGPELLGPEDLLTVPKEVVSGYPVALAFEGRSQPVSPGEGVGGLRLLKATGEPLKDSLPGDRLRNPSNLDTCLLVADSASDPPPVFVSDNHLRKTEAGWALDDALAAGLARETWHGAAAVSVEDGKVIGVLLAPGKGPKRIIPLTEDRLRP